MDNSLLVWRNNGPFDAIVTDPPYGKPQLAQTLCAASGQTVRVCTGVRAGARKLGSKTGHIVPKELCVCQAAPIDCAAL